MTRRQVRNAYQKIRLSEQEKGQVLEQIISASDRKAPDGKEITMKRRNLKPVLIAAIVALMVLLMGSAWAVMHLEDLKVGESVSRGEVIDSRGNVVKETQMIRDLISLQGIAGSANQMAAREWIEFEEYYCTNHADRIENLFIRPDDYQAYGVGNQEMVDKVDEICDKYGLKVAGKVFYAEREDAQFLLDALKLDSIVTDGAGDVQYLGGYFYSCGNFNLELEFRLNSSEACWNDPIPASMRYTDKEYLDTVLWSVDPERVEQWNYTCENGAGVLLVITGNRGAILYDRGDAFLYVGFSTVQSGETGVENTMTHRDLELIAEAMDFYVCPAKPDMQTVESAYLEIEKKRAEEQERQENMPQSWEKESYGEVLNMFPWWDCFALRDITGDGAEELLIGMEEDRFFWGFTMEDGVTKSLIQTGNDLYLCENGIIESFCENEEVILHRYYHVENGKCVPVDGVEYDKEARTWGKHLNADPWTDVEITEEEAMQIVNAYPRIPLEMKPVSEFPGDR